MLIMTGALCAALKAISTSTGMSLDILTIAQGVRPLVNVVNIVNVFHMMGFCCRLHRIHCLLGSSPTSEVYSQASRGPYRVLEV
jgi:hypothetical protein